MDKDTNPTYHSDDTESPIGTPPVPVKQTIIGPTARARDAATGDPLPNQTHAKLAGHLTNEQKDAWLRGMRRASRDIKLEMSTDEYQQHQTLIEMLARDDLTTDEKMAQIDIFDPGRKFVSMALERGEQDLQQMGADIVKKEKLVRSLELYRDWEHEETARYVLQKNECSRLHKMLDACYNGLFYDGDDGKFMWADPKDPQGVASAKVFVVRHDWAAAFGADNEIFDPQVPFKLPYPVCAFEFKVSGRVVIVTMTQSEQTVECCGCLEGVDGVWFSLGVEAMASIVNFCERQVRAICIALEAQVAEHEVTRAPAKLNAKRVKDGKTPLFDYRIVDLSRRIKARSRAEPRPDAEPTGRRVRMHWRRGHWRHYPTHTTWIEWMLVGDPDLGFIDKEYRL